MQNKKKTENNEKKNIEQLKKWEIYNNGKKIEIDNNAKRRGNRQ